VELPFHKGQGINVKNEERGPAPMSVSRRTTVMIRTKVETEEP
jgi:hypothetical protein